MPQANAPAFFPSQSHESNKHQTQNGWRMGWAMRSRRTWQGRREKDQIPQVQTLRGGFAWRGFPREHPRSSPLHLVGKLGLGRGRSEVDCSCYGDPNLSHKAILELGDYSQIDSPWKWVLPAPSVPISSHSLRNKKRKERKYDCS